MLMDLVNTVSHVQCFGEIYDSVILITSFTMLYSNRTFRLVFLIKQILYNHLYLSYDLFQLFAEMCVDQGLPVEGATIVLIVTHYGVVSQTGVKSNPRLTSI